MIGLDAGDGLLLALREAHLSDRVAHACRRNRARLAATTPWAAPDATDDAVAAYDADTLRRLGDGTGLDLAIVRGDTVLGAVSAAVDADLTAELGWWVDAQVEGTGVAYRAVSTLAEHLVGRRGVARLAARTLPDEHRSSALATRLGLEHLGEVGGIRVWQMSAAAWRTRHAATGAELALAVDDALEMVLPEPRFVPAVHEMTCANLARLRRWEPWAQTQPTLRQTAAWWRSRMELFAAGEAYPLVPRRRGSVGLGPLGSIGATLEPSWSIATVGYWLDEAATGQGVARRCVARLVDLLLDERHMDHVGLSTAVDNARSRALAEDCGFVWAHDLPAHQRIDGVDVDCVAYVRLR